MLTAQLPFDVSDQSAEYLKLLVKAISLGLTRLNFDALSHTTVELKSILTNILSVIPETRFGVGEVMKDVWIVDEVITMSLNGVENVTLTSEESIKVLETCRAYFTLTDS